MISSRIVQLAPRRRSALFSAVRVDAVTLGVSMDPFLAVDRFSMVGPTFPPHPHAGFSAVTYVLPESMAAISNRDSRGDASLIHPGGLHWTAAGAGMLHEEVPAVSGAMVEGLQIFVNHASTKKLMQPQVYHLEPSDIPHIGHDVGGWVRVVAGRFGAIAAPLEPPTAVTLLDIALAPASSFTWNDAEAPARFAYILDGEVCAGETTGAQNAVVLPSADGVLAFSAAGSSVARAVFFAGMPLGEPVVWRGPFAMADEAQADDAVRRFRSGAMGTLEPSTIFP